MANTRQRLDPSGEGDASDYLIARLALWAGDGAEAEARLSVYRGGPITRVSHLVNKSAVRTLRQLKRRRHEYEAIHAAANLEYRPTTKHILRSRGGHLGAVLWVETEREYELRVFLRDVGWEAQFYATARDIATRLGGMAAEPSLVPEYGRDEPSASFVPRADLAIEWADGDDTILLQVAVSDFCTASVRGTWSERSLPSRLRNVIQPFQRILDQWDQG